MFKLNANYELLFTDLENQEKLVSIKQCFPRTHAQKYLSVVDRDGSEQLLIEDLRELSNSDRKIIEQYLKFKNFRFGIQQILEVKEEFGVRTFKVETDKGKRTFQMPLQDWPIKSETGQVVFEDINADIYVIENLAGLDNATKKALFTYVD